MEDKYIGKRFGCYKIIGIGPKRANDGHLKYIGKCVYCGETTTSLISTFKDIKSDNCTHFSKVFDRKTPKPEDSIKDFRIRRIYFGMLGRCYNKKLESYRFYGEKSIKVCDEWFIYPKLFEEWALANGYEDGLTIDRIDSSKSYSPENCRWVSMVNNSKWKSTTRTIEVDDIVDSGRGWSKRLGLGVNFVNVYCRKHGLDKTKDYIKDRLHYLKSRGTSL